VAVVDTNILVHAVDADSPFHSPCRSLVESLAEGDEVWHVTWPILYEFLRVSSHPRVLKDPFSLSRSWSVVRGLLESRTLRILTPGARHLDVANEVFAELPDLGANLMHDAATAVLMREHRIRHIFTRDSDFKRFPFIEIVTPPGA